MRQVFCPAHCGRHAPSGRRLLHEEKINEQSISLSNPAKHLQQWMHPINSDTFSHAISNEISKPNRAQGRAEAMRQVFFLAYCGRHAQSGRRLLCDEKINDEFFSAACPTSATRLSLAETFTAIFRHFRGPSRQKFIKEFKKIGCGIFGTNTQ
ncbi:MAG: hypothetical protein L0G95_12035 [Planococcus sp. (in: firmicutes)]|nr:hypothetical protein [Planococcus sp. (in: firmicutes)]